MNIAGRLQLAHAHLAGGNPVVTDTICRDILDVDPTNAAAMDLLGVLAARLGFRKMAIDYFRASLASDPNYRPAKDNLRSISKMPPRAAPKHTIRGRRYLLIKAWGFGFWSDVNHVLGALLLAELTERVPVVHWGSNSLFSDGSGRDAFQFYFETVSSYTLDTLKTLDGADFFPNKWSASNLGLDDQAKLNGAGSQIDGILFFARPEAIAVTDFYIGLIDLWLWIPKTHRLFGKSLEVVYRDLAARYLRPRPHITSAVEQFYCEHLSGAPAIAVHVRGSDKHVEYQNNDTINARYFEVLDQLDQETRIFLLTDDARWAEAFRARYGDRLVMTSSERTAGSMGVHTLPHADRPRLGVEVMVDTYLALRCSRFLGNGNSNVSAVVAALKPWGRSECTLLARSQLYMRGLAHRFRANDGPEQR